MTKFVLLLVLSFVFFSTNAQRKDSSENRLLMQFEESSFTGTLPVKEPNVIDCRFDTTKIGNLKKRKKDFKLVMKEGLAATIQQLLNKSCNERSSDQSLLVVIKRFWLREPSEADLKKLYRNDDRPHKPFWVESVKMDVYSALAENYIPLFRLDSSYYIGDVRGGEALSTDALNDCLARLQKIDFEKVALAKTKLSRKAVDSFNRAPFQKAILQNPDMQTGVFLTFADFLNNRVRYPDFDVELGKEVDNLYLVNNGTRELLPRFWGFCDGKNYYIRSGKNFYALYRVGNAFEFTGALLANYLAPPQGHSLIPYKHNSMELGTTAANTGLNALFFIGNRNFEPQTFQINMETGEVY